MRRNFRKPLCSNCSGGPGLRTGEARYFAAVEITLDHICEGGIYDHLGGGFSRYSVDERWLVPHFEKMLYDNAQLLELLAIAYQRSGKPLYRQRAYETVAWLEREMTTAEGAFSASLDADSEGEEGKFYVWSYDEVIRQLGIEDGEFFARHYDVTPAGNFEGHNILNRLKPSAAQRSRRGAARHLARKTPCRARHPRASRSRRQSARRLERHDDRGAGQCGADVRPNVLARTRGTRLSISSPAR